MKIKYEAVQASKYNIIYELNVKKYKTNIALLKYYFNVGKKAKAFNNTFHEADAYQYWF